MRKYDIFLQFLTFQPTPYTFWILIAIYLQFHIYTFWIYLAVNFPFNCTNFEYTVHEDDSLLQFLTLYWRLVFLYPPYIPSIFWIFWILWIFWLFWILWIFWIFWIFWIYLAVERLDPQVFNLSANFTPLHHGRHCHLPSPGRNLNMIFGYKRYIGMDI